MTAALAVGVLDQAWSAPTQAADSFVTTAVYTADAGSDPWAVRTVSYSTGDSGRKVRWLPYRPSKGSLKPDGPRPASDETKQRFAQYTSPVSAKTTEGGAIDPFDDPFEDAKKASRPSPATAPLADGVLQGAGPQAPLTGSFPQITVEDSDLDSESLDEPVETPEVPLEESLVAAPRLPKEPCAAAQLEPISEITHDISAEGDMFPVECPLAEGTLPERQTQGWAPITFTWKASGLCHKPSYFEDVHLEVYGHSYGPYLQPVISGAHFFLTVPILPYKMGLYPPHECIYSLGYYRPGSCAPYMLDPLPLSIRAGLAQAGVWTGMAFLIP